MGDSRGGWIGGSVSPPSICQTILVMVNFVEPSALPTQRENFLDPRM